MSTIDVSVEQGAPDMAEGSAIPPTPPNNQNTLSQRGKRKSARSRKGQAAGKGPNTRSKTATADNGSPLENPSHLSPSVATSLGSRHQSQERCASNQTADPLPFNLDSLTPDQFARLQMAMRTRDIEERSVQSHFDRRPVRFNEPSHRQNRPNDRQRMRTPGMESTVSMASTIRPLKDGKTALSASYGRTGGSSLDNAEPLTTIEELYELLRSSYSNLDAVAEARDELYHLWMKDTEDFYSFSYLDPCISFNNFQNKCSSHAQQLAEVERVKKQRQESLKAISRRPFVPGTRSQQIGKASSTKMLSDQKPESVSWPVKGTPGVASSRPSATPERKRDIRSRTPTETEGVTCYSCGVSGHIAPNCPNHSAPKNGIAIRVRTLIDTGAEVYLLGNRSITTPLAQRWDLPQKRFDSAATLNGFGKGQPQVVNTAIAANFQIQGRTFRNTPILEADFRPQKSFDLIIGKLFLAAHDLLPDCRRHQLIFPKQMPYLSNWKTDITTAAHQLLRSRPINPPAQQDMLQRDAKWKDKEIAPRKILRRPQVLATWASDHSKSLQKMADQLLGRNPSTVIQRNSSTHLRSQALSSLRYNREAVVNALGTDVHIVSGNVFFQHANRYGRIPRYKRHSYEDVFSFSIYELDRAIDYSVDKEDAETQNLLRARLPAEVEDFIDVFSKTESDELPPLREGIDHQIELKPDAKSLRLHPLYNMKADHLVALKQYLTEHLRKDWIVPSAAEYGSPVLFAKKPNGSLRFCVDYRELNAQSKKDCYPLPLISETLDRLTRAKLFTKLDIRAAFNRIRMDPASEDLTTFRTRFGQYKYKVLPFGLCNGPSTFQR
ncbi:hypothetical protein NPX13_g4222 [Xylaria arbuscula]|uniref:CCHC-type domain-containing protein n=1 Tax=Xylaria arbuscula TaxID=114810 RepID=A0A9W8NG97_9PEZI|nr:hypothetical protein NPX13_g4222 [Xylaria arbuscula]